MKIYKLPEKISYFLGLIWMLISCISISFAQSPEAEHQGFIGSTYYQHKSDDLYTSSPHSVTINKALGDEIKSAKLWLKLDLGENYAFADIDFGVDAMLQLMGIPSNPNILFHLDNEHPEALYYLDITNDISSINNISVLLDDNNDKVYVNPAHSQIQSSLEDSLRVTIGYEITYKINAKTRSISNTSVNITDKTATFSWNTDSYAPNYQFQLLRLYNIDPDRQKQNDVRAFIDWSKALTLETQSGQEFLNLTMAEGTGFYVWRVRPIGSRAGGITHPLDFGEWSFKEDLYTITPSSTVEEQSNVSVSLQENQIDADAFFYYYDNEEELNYIYSRTFTEQNRVSESITYATKLNQAKQSQTYLPSQNNTITTQTVYDYAGRPVIQTLPVPKVQDGLKGYKKNFVKADSADNIAYSGRSYQARDFDLDSLVANPHKISDSLSLFDYYSGQNHIPDAEGYAYSIVRYYDDGTNRVKEQSGVGRTHMIGDNTITDGGGGRTTKTYFSTASEYELVRLFGSEAPDASSVIKTITVDPNNTTSITYTSKEGNVIATCLLYQNQEVDNLKSLDGVQPQSIQMEDFITENFEKYNKVVSSKRLVFTEDTEINLDYNSICNASQTPPCTFDLEVIIYKIDGDVFPQNLNEVVGDTAVAKWRYGIIDELDTTSSENFKALVRNTISVACGTYKVGKVTLSPGTYLIEKQLSPSDSFLASVQQAQDEVGDKTQPLVDMIADWLNDVQCSDSMEVFFNKVALLEAGLHGCWDSLGTLQPNCDFNTDSLGSDSYFKLLDSYYQDELDLKQGVSFFTNEHKIKLRRYVDLTLNTPDCKNIKIPIGFDQVLDPDNVHLDSIPDEPIKVNPLVFLDKGIQAVYDDATIQNNALIPTQFYPDFEGYSYGYFWDCLPSLDDIKKAMLTTGPLKDTIQKDLFTNSEPSLSYSPTNIIKAFKQYAISLPNESMLNTLVIDSNTTIRDFLEVADTTEAALKIIYIHYEYLYPYMKGWRTPGTFNLMTHHMLTDVYTTDGFASDTANAPLVYYGPEPRQNQCGGTMQLASGMMPEIPAGTARTRKLVEQYYAIDLINCWETQLAYIKSISVKCPDALDLDSLYGESPYKVSDRFDEEDSRHDEHFDDNIRLGWLVRFFLGRKIRRASQKVRTLQVRPENREDPDLQDEPYIEIDFQYHAINEFLNCTGYRFAKILTPSDTLPLPEDIINDNTIYSVPSRSVVDWVSYEGQYRGYYPDSLWQAQFVMGGGSTRPLFEYISDPVYAFKYFEYPQEVNSADTTDNAYRKLELNNCYKKYDTTGTCNICGMGIIQCNATKQSWSAGQRYSFYEMLRNYTPDTLIVLPEIRAEHFVSPGYPDLDDQGNPIFWLWANEESELLFDTPLTDEAAYQALLDSAFVQEPDSIRLLTKVELDINAFNNAIIESCESKRVTLTRELTQMLEDKCYEIVDCIEDTTKQILRGDIDILVQVMIDECKKRGMITSFRAYNQACKYAYNFGQTQTIPVLEYGVRNDTDTTRNQPHTNILYPDSLQSYNFSEYTQGDSASYILKTINYRGDSIPIINYSSINEDKGHFTYMDTLSVGYPQGCEWLKRKQVMLHTLEFDIPCVCDSVDQCRPDGAIALCNCNDPDCSDQPCQNIPANPNQPPSTSGVIRRQVDISKTNEVTVKELK